MGGADCGYDTYLRDTYSSKDEIFVGSEKLGNTNDEGILPALGSTVIDLA